MFSMPRYFLKGGEVVLDDGEIRQPVAGDLLHVAPARDGDVEAEIAEWFDARSSIRFANYAMGEGEVNRPSMPASGRRDTEPRRRSSTPSPRPSR